MNKNKSPYSLPNPPSLPMISLGRIVLSMEINQGKTFSFAFEEEAAMVYGLFFKALFFNLV